MGLKLAGRAHAHGTLLLEWEATTTASPGEVDVQLWECHAERHVPEPRKAHFALAVDPGTETEVIVRMLVERAIEETA